MTSGDGITIDGPAVLIGLRGLTINGPGGDYAIHFVQGAHLLVEGCEIANLGSGVKLEAPDSGVSIRNTRIHDNTSAGVYTLGTTGGMQLSIVDSEIANNGVGVEVSASALVQPTVAHSTLTRNHIALDVIGDPGGNASLLSDGNTIMYSTTVFMQGGLGVYAIFSPGNNTAGYYGMLTNGGVLTPCCGT